MQWTTLLTKPNLRRLSLAVMLIAAVLVAYGLYSSNDLSRQLNEKRALIKSIFNANAAAANNASANSALQGSLMAIDSDVKVLERQQGEATVQTGLSAALFGLALIGYLQFSEPSDKKK